MSKFRPFRRSWKFIVIWMVLLAVALTQKGRDFCSSRQDNLCEEILADLTTAKVFFQNYGLYIVAAVVLLLILKPLLRLSSREDKSTPGFKNCPWQYDKEIIKLTGRVEKVFYNPWQEKLKRKITDIYRNITKNDDQTYRNIHQRFLISSPQLRNGELMMVEHNPKFGKVSLSKGTWLVIQGEYIHRRSRRRGTFGNSYTFYGRMHSTYEPKGFIRPLGRKAPNLTNKVIEVVSRQSQID